MHSLFFDFVFFVVFFSNPHGWIEWIDLVTNILSRKQFILGLVPQTLVICVLFLYGEVEHPS